MTTNEFVLNYISKAKKTLAECEVDGFTSYIRLSEGEYKQIVTYLEVIEDLMKVSEQ